MRQQRLLGEVIVFQWGEPVQVALKYEGLGKPFQTTGGRTRFLFTLKDERVMFMDESEAQRIALEFANGQPFWICKRRGQGKGAPIVWDMWRGDREGFAERQLTLGASQLEKDLARSLDRVSSSPGAPGNGSIHGELVLPAFAPTSTSPESKPVGSARASSNPPLKIPMDEAVVEAVRMVQQAMKETGEQWGDQAKQDLAATILIGAQREGWLACWKRGIA